MVRPKRPVRNIAARSWCADVRRFSRLINADEVLGTHTDPGSRFGHEVTMRQRRLSLCANPGAAGAAITPTRHNAPPRARVRRVILLIVVSRAGQIYGPSL